MCGILVLSKELNEHEFLLILQKENNSTHIHVVGYNIYALRRMCILKAANLKGGDIMGT